DFRDQGMHAMFDDFMASMYAAWSPEEMAATIPKTTKRVWYQVVAGFLPFYQVLVGLPEGREQLFMRESYAWENAGLFRSETARQDWVTTRPIYYAGQIKKIERILPTVRARAA